MPAGMPGRVASSSDPGEPSHPPPSGGLLAALRALTDDVLGSVHDRFELLSIELHEEKHRLIHVLIWISATVFAAMLAIIFASGVLVVAFWDTRARLPIIGGLAVAYVVLAVIGIAKCRRLLASGTRPFSDTLSELKVDRACLETKS